MIHVKSRRAGALAAVAIAAGALGLLPAAPAFADPGAMNTPASGEVTGIVGNHCGLDDEHDGIDIARGTGGPIYAAADGTITTSVNSSATTGYGTQIIITHANGYTTLYGHMVDGSILPGGTVVTKGQQIGQMGNTGNSTGVHLHFEVRINGESQDGVNAFFPCGTIVGAGTPIGWEFPGFSGAPAGVERVASLQSNGNLLVKDGIAGAWVLVARNVTDFAISGDRIGVVLTDGRAQVKSGPINSTWTTISTGERDIEMSGNRIAVISTNNVLEVKEGAVNATFTTLAMNSKQVALSGTRIASISVSNNAIEVKDGALNALWTLVDYGTDVSLDGSRIGVITNQGQGRVKEGPVNAAWTVVETSASNVELSGTRIGVQVNGTLKVKEGAVNAGWTVVATGVTSFSLSGQKIARVTAGTAFVKNGAVNAGWTTLETGSERIAVTG